jgi:hypothetical protein
MASIELMSTFIFKDSKSKKERTHADHRRERDSNMYSLPIQEGYRLPEVADR